MTMTTSGILIGIVSPCMLPAAHRLRRKQDVERVSRVGRPAFVRTLTVRYTPNGLAVSRATVVAGLKVHKRSTRRNRVKRLLREALRREYLTHLRSGYDVVIYAKKDLVDMEYAAVAADLGSALRRARLLMSAPPRTSS